MFLLDNRGFHNTYHYDLSAGPTSEFRPSGNNSAIHFKSIELLG